MDQTSGRGSLIVSLPTDGKSTLEMDITEVFKSASLPGIPIEITNLQIIPIVQSDEIKLKLRVTFKNLKDGTLGPPVDTTQEYKDPANFDDHVYNELGICTGCGAPRRHK